MADTPATVTVPVQSALSSKINWAQAVSIVSVMLVWFFGPKAEMSIDTQLALSAFLPAALNLVTIVLRTWFTRTVTPASVAK